MGGPGREQGVVLSFVSNDDVQEQPAQRGARGRKASVVALIGALALAGAAVGAVFFARGAEDDGASADTDPESDSAAFADLVGGGVSATAVESDVVWGRAKLNLGNKLEWVLRGLEQNSQGTVHLHAGKSCDDVGPSLWYAEAGVNPWSSVVWTSNHKGKSTGTVEINSLDGAYSFAGNLKHAVVFYSEAEEVLACGILNAKSSYRKYGVRSSLNGGFAVHHSELTAGEVILSKKNKLSWGLYNLGADQVGALEVLAGRDCSDPSNTWLSMEWQSNAYGVSEGDVSLGFDEYDFSELVDRAVAVRDADGAVVVCDMLSGFVESTTEALEAIEMELRDIEDTIKSEQDEVTPAPTQGPSRSLEPTIPYEVTNPPTNEPTAGPVVSPTMPPTLPPVPPTPVPTDAPVITPTTSVPPTPVPTESSTTTPPTAPSSSENVVATLQPLFGSGYECVQTAMAYRAVQDLWFPVDLERKVAMRNYSLAETAVSSGTATQVQLDFIANYSAYESDIAQRFNALERQLEELKERYSEIPCLSDACQSLPQDSSFKAFKKDCPEEYLCERFSGTFPELVCPSRQIACSLLNHSLAMAYMTYGKELAVQESLRFDSEVARGLHGPAEDDYFDNARYFWYQQTVDMAYAEVSALKDSCNMQTFVPLGTITLDDSGLLSWNMTRGTAIYDGTIKIFEGTTCDPKLLGDVYSIPGTTPFDAVTWASHEGPNYESAMHGDITLAELDGALTYEEYKTHATVVISADEELLSCGILN